MPPVPPDMGDPTKLSQLRQAIGQIPAFKTKRRSFTKAQRKAVFDLFEGQCGCGCEESLAGQVWDIDHAIPLALGGAHEPGNWVPMIHAHHVRKTALDRKAIAKAERILAREDGTRRPRKAIPNRGWPEDSRKLQSRKGALRG